MNEGDYARPKTLRLIINGNPHCIIELQNTNDIQWIDTEELMIVAESITDYSFEVLDSYPGTTNQQTTISELYFKGE